MVGSKLVKFLMSILKQQIISSSNFESFFNVMAHSSYVKFKLIHSLLWTKESHQKPNFDTFNCSGEDLSNSSCHFSNHKSVCLQIVHLFYVWRKINPLYFFRSNAICFAKKDLIKVQIFKNFESSGQN